MKKIIAVASGKGGTGKSTVSLGIGRELAEDGFKVLLIDCDSGMRGLDLLLGTSKSVVFDMADAVSGECEVENCVYSCGSHGNLFMVPAPDNAEDELSPAVFNSFIDAVKDVFDYIIVDSPAGLGLGLKSAVSCADTVLVVCNPEPTSIRGCLKVRRILSEYGAQDVRLVINKFEGKKFSGMGLYPDLDSIIDSTGIRLIAVIPEDNRMIASIQSGKPAEKSSIAKSALYRLAQRIQGENIPLDI